MLYTHVRGGLQATNEPADETEIVAYYATDDPVKFGKKMGMRDDKMDGLHRARSHLTALENLARDIPDSPIGRMIPVYGAFIESISEEILLQIQDEDIIKVGDIFHTLSKGQEVIAMAGTIYLNMYKAQRTSHPSQAIAKAFDKKPRK
ncbi:MAG: hypothetical protein Q7J78_04930, partial [Clostridiales bacterium]|nr:hypothetical protein [Clostridiales bacterium]